jgi:serine/threonine-protein kinase
LLERFSGWSARVLGTFTAVAAPITIAALLSDAGTSPMVRAVGPVVALLAGAAAALGLSYLVLMQLRRDVDTEFWQWVWTQGLGRDFFAIAKRLHRGGPIASAMTHRATELSLGMAAEQLYESLPKETRQELRGLPELLTRLQRDAQGLRERYDQLQDAIGDAGSAAAGKEYESVRTTRDMIEAKLGDAVGALETIRLNLLRLHAGSVTVEGFTTHLGIAADVSAEIDRLIAAHDDVAAHLRFPSEAEPTPA